MEYFSTNLISKPNINLSDIELEQLSLRQIEEKVNELVKMVRY